MGEDSSLRIEAEAALPRQAVAGRIGLICSVVHAEVHSDRSIGSSKFRGAVGVVVAAPRQRERDEDVGSLL